MFDIAHCTNLNLVGAPSKLGLTSTQEEEEEEEEEDTVSGYVELRLKAPLLSAFSVIRLPVHSSS